MSIKYLPNILSLLRLFLVIPFVYFFLRAQFQPSLIIFIIAAFTDALDGWLARHFNCQTNFGLIIDPLADKILIVSCILLLGYHHVLPIWFVLLVLGRDLAITFGAFIAMYIFDQPSPLQPSLISKLNTVLQMMLILSCLIHISYIPLPIIYLNILIALVTLTIITSFFHYLFVWYKGLK